MNREQNSRLKIAIPRIALALAFLLIFITRLTYITDHDTFMHIRTGQWIVENGQVPRSEAFSWSAPGARWDDHEWLFQLLTYSLYRVGGFTALGLFRAAWVTLTLFLLFLLCRMRGASTWLAGTLALVAAAGVAHFNEPRPYVVTPTGLVLFAIALEKMRAGRFRWILLPPLVMIPWVNMHAGFTAGCLFLLVCFAGGLLEELQAWFRGQGKPAGARKSRRRNTEHGWRRWLKEKNSGRVFACGVLTLGAVLLNPYGWRILLFPFKLVGHDVLMLIIQEWNRTVWNRESAVFFVFAGLVALRGLALVRRARPTDLLLLGVFGYLALSAERHTGLFFFVVAPAAGEWLSSIRLPGRAVSPKGTAALLARWAGVLALSAWWMLPPLWTSPVWRFGHGPNPRMFPTRAVDLVRQYRLEPRLFNGYNFGGYLIYRLFPDYSVFIDGRADVYGVDINLDYAHIVYLQVDSLEFFDRVGVNFVLLDTPVMARRNLVDAMVESPDWVLVYWDDVATLFVRDIPRHAEIIRNEAYRYIHPLKVDQALTNSWPDVATRQAGLRELERRASKEPPAAHVERNLSFILGRDERTTEALAATEKYLELFRDNASMIARKGQLLEQLGRTDEARRAYREAIRRNRRFGVPLTRLGVLAQAEEDWKTAERWYRRAAKADPPDPVGMLQYARALMNREAWDEAKAALEQYLAIRPDDETARILLQTTLQAQGSR